MADIQDLLKARYYHPGENSWNDLCERVSKFLYPDTWLGVQLHEAMVNKQFIPSTPVLANAGSQLPMLCSCFVIPVPDNMAGIMKSLTDTVLIQKYGGGVGLDFSNIRPEGSIVSTTNGKASGPVSFMGLWNTAMDVVKQGGKRQGALMGALSVHHQDLYKFIKAKEVEGKLTNMNISVALDDKFFADLEKQQLYACGFTPHQILNDIAYNAWRNGEPGILFLDNINKNNKYGEAITCCNPCHSGETKVWTINGPRTFVELASKGENVDVLTQTEEGKLVFRTMHTPRQTGVQPIWELTLDNGGVVRATANHKFILKDGSKKELCLLMPGDRLASVYKYKANSKEYVKITNGIEEVLEHYVVIERVVGRRPEYPSEHVHHKDHNRSNNTPDNLELLTASQHMRMHMLGKDNPMYGVWDERNPLFGIDVSGKNNPRYNKDVTIENVMEMRRNGMTRKEMAAYFGCSISPIKNRIKWAKTGANHVVVKVEKTNCVEPVYNGTVDETHTYFVMVGEKEAILSKNCGEQPLPPYGACCLGSINLNAALDFNGKVWYINNDKLRDLVNLGVNALNAVLDKTWWPLPEIAEFENTYRPIGLGVMGLADVMAKLSVIYGKSSEFVNRLFANIRQMAEDASRHYTITTLKPMNRTVLSIAPTGSIAQLADCSYGIEPYFAMAYKKVVNAGTFYEEVKTLPEVLEAWGVEYTEEAHKIVQETGSVQYTDLPEDIKLIFRTATEIPWDEHLMVQADVQAHVDSAVSKTINLPKDATVETVRKIIMLAHTLGVKGITVYRSGSREVEVMQDCPSGVCNI